ncbi:(3S,6E)-nerolidol synthase 1 [Nicotiana tabacum]|uniref:(3S,6E)-nerolidol synthase 1 n=1 Tax=Nicotiana tabacum TaxID=4097 RepID=A0A1S4DBZ1_TOBAC|nr:(3S,6E)-nerolidol synthase 1 [Nicotiana tomentosiformis]XP_016510950.1 PREDICTED: (3S,6E)-nerolidol synthase 1 [Nicotiana tabacum]
MAMSRALSPSYLCMHISSSCPNGSSKFIQVSCGSSNKRAVQEDLLRTTSHRPTPTNFNQDGFHRKFALVEDVKHELKTNVNHNRLDNLVLIDALQRMGIDYHFQEEIESVLEEEYVQSACFLKYQTHFEVSLCFRLLRQQGYYVPADVFKKFKNKYDGTFGLNLSQDISGLIGLYEAAQLGVEGEHILDEVANFSGQKLNAYLEHNDCVQARIINDTLKYPYHKSLASYKAKNFITNFRGVNGWGRSTLQELANIDFSIAREIHQHEMSQVSRWWRSLGLVEDLKLLRDQPLKWYAWPMALFADPRMSLQRIELAKCISFIYVIDDIFDVYGTVEELTLFTEAVNRWELDAMVDLPEYMRTPYRALYDTINGIGYNIYKIYGWNPTENLRKTWGNLCNAFLKEAKWFADGVIPAADEYLKNGLVSSGVHVLSVHMFYLLGFGVTNNESSINLEDTSAMASSGAMILRLWDDLGSAKDENQEGNDGSYIECYMKGQKIASFELARNHVFKLIEDEWKQLNKEHLRLSRSLGSFTKALLNFARMVPLMYNYDDKHSLPILQEYIKSMLHV